MPALRENLVSTEQNVIHLLGDNKEEVDCIFIKIKIKIFPHILLKTEKEPIRVEIGGQKCFCEHFFGPKSSFSKMAYVAEVKNIVLQLFQLNTGMKFGFFP